MIYLIFFYILTKTSLFQHPNHNITDHVIGLWADKVQTCACIHSLKLHQACTVDHESLKCFVWDLFSRHVMKPETMKERLFEGHFQCFPYNNKTVFKLQTTIYNDLSNISWKMTTELADGWKKIINATSITWATSIHLVMIRPLVIGLRAFSSKMVDITFMVMSLNWLTVAATVMGSTPCFLSLLDQIDPRQCWGMTFRKRSWKMAEIKRKWWCLV